MQETQAFIKRILLADAAKMFSMDSEPPKDTGTGDTDPNTDDLLPIRYLQISDHAKGFVELLGQLSPCPPISITEFCSRFEELGALGDDHVICVIEDPKTSRIVATGSVFVEKKFLRGCGKVGHIEDVVVDDAARCRRLGQRVVQFLAEHARVAGCYKVILDCTSELRAFYEKCGFVEKNVQMAMYFQD